MKASGLIFLLLLTLVACTSQPSNAASSTPTASANPLNAKSGGGACTTCGPVVPAPTFTPPPGLTNVNGFAVHGGAIIQLRSIQGGAVSGGTRDLTLVFFESSASNGELITWVDASRTQPQTTAVVDFYSLGTLAVTMTCSIVTFTTSQPDASGEIGQTLSLRCT